MPMLSQRTDAGSDSAVRVSELSFLLSTARVQEEKTPLGADDALARAQVLCDALDDRPRALGVALQRLQLRERFPERFAACADSPPLAALRSQALGRFQALDDAALRANAPLVRAAMALLASDDAAVFERGLAAAGLGQSLPGTPWILAHLIGHTVTVGARRNLVPRLRPPAHVNGSPPADVLERLECAWSEGELDRLLLHSAGVPAVRVAVARLLARSSGWCLYENLPLLRDARSA
jgi:hypothetical protein